MPKEIHNLGPHSLFYKREENRAEENWDCYQGKGKNGQQLTGARAAEFR